MKRIRDLLDSLGLKKVTDGMYDSYFVLSSKVPLFGEVIRLFPLQDRVVFFVQLKEKSSPVSNGNILHIPYTHLFKDGLETIPNKFERFKHENHFILEGTQEELDFIKWLVQNAIKQKKELEQKIELDKIEKDF